MSEGLIGERLERWLGSQRGRVHAELQARFGFEQESERGGRDRAADAWRDVYAQRPEGSKAQRPEGPKAPKGARTDPLRAYRIFGSSR